VKGLALTVAFLALPASAWAQVLTLNFRYENAYEPAEGGTTTPMTGGFSAIIHMNNLGSAKIETTTIGCFNYVGAFDEQEVVGNCERLENALKFQASLTINRINGEFSHTTLLGQSYWIYSGHCTVAKKFF
jgi:hypothetical protein